MALPDPPGFRYSWSSTERRDQGVLSSAPAQPFEDATWAGCSLPRASFSSGQCGRIHLPDGEDGVVFVNGKVQCELGV